MTAAGTLPLTAELRARARHWRPSLPAGAGFAYAVLLVAFGAAVISGFHPDLTRDILNHVAPLTAVALAFAAVQATEGRTRRGWVLLGTAIAFWVAGDAVSTVYTFVLDETLPFPSVAEPLYYTGYLLMIPGIVLVCLPSWHFVDARAKLDALTVIVSGAVIIWQAILVPALSDTGSAMSTTFAVGYPVLDFAVLTILVVAYYGGGEKSSVRIALLALAICTSITADGIYAVRYGTDGTYPAFLDVLFVATYCLFGTAFAHARQARADEQPAARSRFGLWLPRCLSAPIVVVVLLHDPLHIELAPAVSIGAFALVLLILIRQVVTTRENRQLVQALEEDRRFREALSQAQSDLGEAFMVVEGTQLIDINDAALRIGGYSRENLHEFSLLDFVAPHDRPRAFELLTRVVTHGEVVEGFEVDTVAIDGREQTLECAAKQFTVNGANRIMILARDITARKLAEQAMVEAQKFESMGILAGGVAHDFNNLLTVIRGNSDLLKSVIDPESPEAEFLGDIVTSTERASGLARQMLAYAGRAEAITEPVDVSSLVEEMVLLLRSSVSKQVELSVEAQPGLQQVMGDPSQLRQVVMNLVINASEAIGDTPGSVVVTTSLLDATPEDLRDAVPVRTLRPGRYVAIDVEDTGSGMDEATRRRIFDPFYSTKFAGRGLGLASVMGLVRIHHGGIIVESEPGVGTRFRVLIPVHEEPAAQTLAEAS